MWPKLNFFVRSALLTFVLQLYAGVSVQGANPVNGLRIEVLKNYNFVVDSNVESPSAYSPRSAYLGARICNDGATTISNLTALIGNYSGIGSTNTPGVYPARTHLTLVGPLDGGAFSLTHQGGTAGNLDATRYLKELEAGECVLVYWLVSYPEVDINGDAVWGPSIKPDDDLFLFYDIWATGTRTGTVIEADTTTKVTMRNEITSSANKVVPNTANKVPQEYKDLLQTYAPTWTNTVLNGSPGEIITAEGYWFDLGIIGEGFDNDGDLIPDRNAWLQPVGDPARFDPSCFRLVKTFAFIIVKLKAGGELILIGDDQLYFENVPPNNGAVGFVSYQYAVIRTACSSLMTPYQEVASGRDNEKYNSDFGATPGGNLIALASPASITKLVDAEAALSGETLSYTLVFTNAGSEAVGAPSNGLPLSVQDSIPEGTTYISGSAAASNTLPAGVTSFTLLYSTNGGFTWAESEPSPASAVTDLQWWLSDPLATGTAGQVTFQVLIDTPVTNDPPRIRNTGSLGIANGPPFDSDIVFTLLEGSNALNGTVFGDIGTGGGVEADGILNGGETGITNVLVSLYYDFDDDGLISPADILMYTTNCSGGVTNYSFNLLPDGNYIVLVDDNDDDIPDAYGRTTSERLTVDLDAAGVSSTGVTVTGLDFGFAPILALTKTGTASVREGSLATYTITITNRFPGDGTGVGTPIEYQSWATNVSVALSTASYNTDWVPVANAYSPDFPDLQYAVCALNNNSAKALALKGFTLDSQTYTITNVSLRVHYSSDRTFRDGDELTVTVYTNEVDDPANVVVAFTNNLLELATVSTSGVITNDVSAVVPSWGWNYFDPGNTNLIVQVQTFRSQGGNRSFLLDQVGFVVQTDGTEGGGTDNNTINPTPLYDYYDADLFDFESSTPSVTLADTNGPAPNEGRLYWFNAGQLFPGGSTSVTVNLRAKEPFNNATVTMTNLALITNATFKSGVPLNAASSTVNTVVTPAGTIGDFVWRDVDADGVQDGGDETGIAGVSVTLTPPAGMDLGNGPGNTITNVTDASGLYLFEGLPSNGTYTVSVLTSTLPGGSGTNTYDLDGLTNSPNNTAPVTLTVTSTNGADTELGADFGYVGLQGQIFGSIWEDVDRSGTATKGPLEPYLTNITVQLLTNGTVIATTTATNGTFQFIGSFSGSYVVRVDTNSGELASGFWIQSFDSDGTATTNEVTLSLIAGGSGQADFSYYEVDTYSLGDTVYYDWDGDGVQDAIDEGITNVTLNLYRDINSNGVYDVGIDLSAGSDLTGASGDYLFTQLISNRYVVLVDLSSPGLPQQFNITGDPSGALDGSSGVFITNTNDLNQDFGIQPDEKGAIGDTVWRDLNADGIKSGVTETGIPNVTVTLQFDGNGDGTYVNLQTTTTDASGTYLFTNLLSGSYRVVVDSGDTDLPVDEFGVTWYTTTAVTNSISLVINSTNLTADFGFAPYGAVGDTIFLDANQNGTQDFNEEGAAGVVVSIYLDEDSDGFFSPGDTLLQSESTDTNGNYFFTGLLPTNYVVVVETTNGTLLGLELSADPNADGLSCTNIAATGCDSEYGFTLLSGQVLAGVDFGYIPADAVIGDVLWIDFDNNGQLNDSESRIPFITVELYTNGTLVKTTSTDADGNYLFSGLADATYYVVVDTNDVDWPAGLVQNYDPDGVADSVGTNIVVSLGAVSSIGGVSCTNCDLNVDFGYRIASTNVLRGTIGLDDPNDIDGVLGTNSFGVTTNEVAFENVTVYCYLWNDDGNGTVEAGETVLVNNTLTDDQGDYGFDDLPVGDGDDLYLVSISALIEGITLTTTTNDTPATVLVNTTNLLGFTTAAYQAMPVTSLVENVDFAFLSTELHDFGDAPNTYDTSYPYGARHDKEASPTHFLGATIDSEENAFPTANADGDDLNNTDDEDGMVIDSRWQNGAGGGSVQVTVGAGSGWLAAYADFNQSSNFVGLGNNMISQSVSTNGGPASNGVYTISLDVPAGSLSRTKSTFIMSRFRYFEVKPVFPQLAYSGDGGIGEVEDYRLAFHVISGSIFTDADDDNNFSGGDLTQRGVELSLFDATTSLVYRTVSDDDGFYSFYGLQDGTYAVQMTTPAGATALLDSDGAGNSVTNIDVTISGASVTNRNFLLDTNATIAGLSGTVYEDDGFGIAGDGAFTTNDAPVPGVVVALYRDLDGDSIADADELIQTASSDAGGAYAFTNLPNADYIITATAPGSSTNVTDIDGTGNGAGLIESTLSGSDITGRDFLLDGVDFVAAIGDRVWFDLNGNGLQDIDETRVISNVTVSLVTTSGFVVAQTTTGTNSLYLFENIPVGRYYLRFDLSSISNTGNLQVTENDIGVDDSKDSDGVYGSIGGDVETLPRDFSANTTNLNIDLGLTYIILKTLASVVEVDGEWRDGAGYVVWETGSEWGTAGFDVFRVDPETGASVQVNDQMIPSVLDERGGVYSWQDPAAKRGGTATYRIEEIELSGRRIDHGTHTVVFDEPVVSRAQRKAATIATSSYSAPVALDTGLPSDCLKVMFTNDGIYAVTFSALAEGMGLTLDEVASAAAQSGLQVSMDDRVIPYAVDTSRSRIIFFGKAHRGFYTRTQAVLIRLGEGIMMSRRDPGATSGHDRYAMTARHEQDRYVLDAHPAPLQDLFYSDYIISSHKTQGSKNFNIDLSGYTDGPARLKVRLVGMSETPGYPDHVAEIMVNSQVVHTVEMSGRQEVEAVVALPSGLLVDGENTVTVRGVRPTTQSFFALDWIECTAERRLLPLEETLIFAPDRYLAVSADTFDAPVALSIADRYAPVLIAEASGDLPGKAWQAAHFNERFALMDAAAVPELTPRSATCDAWFTSSENEIDYLVITARGMEDAAQELADYRASQGLRAGVAVFEDICDVFANGRRTPLAIQEFIRYASRAWASPPWLVVLAGNGNYDYLNALNREYNPLPPLLTQTTEGIASSDGQFADLNGDRVADLAIGRLPALNENHLRIMLAKIQQYEGEHGAAWQQQVAVVMDDTEAPTPFGSAGAFMEDTDLIMQQVDASLTRFRLAKDSIGLQGVRSGLMSAFSDGSGIIHYTGHGNYQTMGDSTSAIFNQHDANALSNTRQPFMVALSCMIGRFEAPGLNSLSELLLQKDTAGAVGVWAPSSQAGHPWSMALGRAFYQALTTEGVATVGLAIQRAIEMVSADPDAAAAMQTYNLLGDPALKVAGLDGIDSGRSGFARWRWQWFAPGELTDASISGVDGDADGSGLANFARYALGLNPGDEVSRDYEGVLSFDPGQGMVFTSKRRNDRRDVDYLLRVSEDLANWEDSPADVEELSVELESDGVTEKVRTRVNRPESNRLFIGRKFKQKP